MTHEGISQTELARRFKKSLAFISNTLRLLKLPAFIQDGLAGGSISEGHARALLTVQDTHKMIGVYREVLVTNATVRQTERMAREANREIVLNKKEVESIQTSEAANSGKPPVR